MNIISSCTFHPFGAAILAVQMVSIIVSIASIVVIHRFAHNLNITAARIASVSLLATGVFAGIFASLLLIQAVAGEQ